MLAKVVLRNSMDLNRRIKEQSVIYQDWKAMAMDIDEARCHQLPGGMDHPSGRGIRRQRLHGGDDGWGREQVLKAEQQ